MNSKKLFALLMACTLIVGMFAACGGKETPAQPQEGETPSATDTTGEEKVLRVAWWGNQVRNDSTVGALNLYSEEHEGVAFETEFSDWTGYWDKMATQAAASSLPDIIQQDYRYYKQYQAKNQLAGLNEFVDSGVLNLDDASEGIIESGKVDGELYALCLGVNAPGMVYDPEAAEAAGVEITNGMTQSEFLEAATKIYEATGRKYDWGYGGGEQYMEYLMRGKGIVMFQDGKLGIDSPDEAVSFFKLFEEGVTTEAHQTAEEMNESYGVGIEQSPLSLGNTWMNFVFSNQLIAYNDAAGKELKMVTWPVGDDDVAPAMYLKPSQFFSVTSSSVHKEEAASVLNFFTNSVEANKVLKAERGVPISATVAEAIKPEVSETEQYVFDYIQEVEPLSAPINPPSPEGMGEVWNVINDIVEQVIYGNYTAEQAADEFFTKANDILAKSAA